jgi:hypothetical protein
MKRIRIIFYILTSFLVSPKSPPSTLILFWCTGPFLGNDRETNKTIAVARQQILKKQQLNYKNKDTVGKVVFCSSRRGRCYVMTHKHLSAAIVERQQQNSIYYVVRAQGLYEGRSLELSQL